MNRRRIIQFIDGDEIRYFDYVHNDYQVRKIKGKMEKDNKYSFTYKNIPAYKQDGIIYFDKKNELGN